MQSIADGDRHRGADHLHGDAADRRAALKDRHGQKADVELLAERVEDRADQQRAEQALRHGAQSVDAVALERDLNVLALEKRFEFTHISTSEKSRPDRCLDTCKDNIPCFLRLSMII